MAASIEKIFYWANPYSICTAFLEGIHYDISRIYGKV
jgi:hypothetical protein